MKILQTHTPKSNNKFRQLLNRALDPCLRCGARFIKTGRIFTLHCVENRVVNFRICRACARIPDVEVTTSINEMKEAA